jgi:hypothetical protein
MIPCWWCLLELIFLRALAMEKTTHPRRDEEKRAKATVGSMEEHGGRIRHTEVAKQGLDGSSCGHGIVETEKLLFVFHLALFCRKPERVDPLHTDFLCLWLRL